MRVLVVEDDRRVGDAVRRALARAGLTVDHVMSAEDAGAALRGEPFELAVVDIGLPHENGLQFVSGLRRRGQSLPVLMLTARDGLSDRVTALDLGADDYLVKPFEVPELVARSRAAPRGPAVDRNST
jgi:two-component system OmpR family response regulator